jgi:hypothetical protein
MMTLLVLVEAVMICGCDVAAVIALMMASLTLVTLEFTATNTVLSQVTKSMLLLRTGASMIVAGMVTV